MKGRPSNSQCHVNHAGRGSSSVIEVGRASTVPLETLIAYISPIKGSHHDYLFKLQDLESMFRILVREIVLLFVRGCDV